MKTPEDEAFEDIERAATRQHQDDWVCPFCYASKCPTPGPCKELAIRNQVLDEVAARFDGMRSLGDTAASFAAYVRGMKK
jgi:hypothetical protein